MSGSHFICEIGVRYSVLQDFISELKREVESGEHEQRTVNHFCDAIRILELANAYLERIDLYLDMDDGEDGFNRRLPWQLTELVDKTYLENALEEVRRGWKIK